MDLRNKIPIKSSRVASRNIDEEAVIVVPRENKVIVLNKVGSFIWELIDGKMSAAHIAAEVAEEFEATKEQAEADTDTFLNELLSKELITF